MEETIKNNRRDIRINYKKTLTMENTTENNKMIAEFMADKKVTAHHNMYHESWNELMPVIEKCRESQIFGRHRLIRNIDKGLMELDIIRTYRNVVDYITWYNNN